MEIKAQLPASLLDERQIDPFVRTYFEICHLKQLYRQGWLQQGIPRERCESVADHTFGVVTLALLLAEAHYPELDICQIVQLAILHDFGEIYAGDLTPQDNLSLEEKQQRETQSVRRVFSKLPGGDKYVQLWQIYENQSSPEARFVKEIDRLEMALQASVYEHLGHPGLDNFYNSARQALTDQALIDLLQSIPAAQFNSGDGKESAPEESTAVLETIQVSTILSASAERIYRAWLDSREHSAFTDKEAQIDPHLGGQFTALNGYIQGTTIGLEPFRRILQLWRTADFPKGSSDSRLEIVLEEVPGGTKVTLLHSGLPEGQGQVCRQGWKENYFEPMNRYFAGKK